MVPPVMSRSGATDADECGADEHLAGSRYRLRSLLQKYLTGTANHQRTAVRPPQSVGYRRATSSPDRRWCAPRGRVLPTANEADRVLSQWLRARRRIVRRDRRMPRPTREDTVERHSPSSSISRIPRRWAMSEIDLQRVCRSEIVLPRALRQATFNPHYALDLGSGKRCQDRFPRGARVRELAYAQRRAWNRTAPSASTRSTKTG